MRKINLGIETLNSRWVPIFFLPFALFTIGYFAFGYYFGWLDDVMMEQHFRGLFTGEPNSEAFYYHRGLSHIYAFLYRLNSSFPWYGVAMCGYIFIATAGLFYAVSRIGGRTVSYTHLRAHETR